MLTRLISGMGADLPGTLIGASATNPAGHWESRKIQLLNDQMLEALGGHWHDWRSLPEGWAQSEIAQSFRAEAEALVQAEFGDAELFVFKDPRICRLAPFWIDVLEGMGIEVLPLIVVRHPLEVAQSLEERNRLPSQVGHLLWLAHVLDAEAATEGRRRLAVDYETVLAGKAEAVLDGIARHFEFDWPVDASVVGDLSLSIDSRLRHQHSDETMLTDRPDLPKWLGPVWSAVESWATSGGAEDVDHTALEKAREGMRAAEPFLGPISTRAREALLYGDRVRAAEWEAHVARKELAERIEEQSALQAELDAIAPEANRAAQELLELRPKLEDAARRQEHLQADLDARYREIVNFSGLLLRLEDERRAMAQRLADEQEAVRHARYVESQRDLYLRLIQALVGPAAGITRMRRKWQLRAALDAVRESGVFDEEYYRRANPDVAGSKTDPLEHFLRFGLAEGRMPNASLAKATS
ncbi:hypothetical protein ACXN5S_01875 [Pseudoroseicyclus sp. H15]